MIPSQQHIYSHQHAFTDWSSAAQGHHNVSHHQLTQQQQHHAQQQAHYNARMNSATSAAPNINSTITTTAGGIGAEHGMEPGSSEENRRVLEWIAQLMRVETRETALLELSKKREQVPELALILWHSYGTLILYLAHDK